MKLCSSKKITGFLKCQTFHVIFQSQFINMFKVVGFMGSCMLNVFLICKKVSFSEALAWGALDSDSGL